MARAADQFRQSDVTLWGIVAIVAGATALLCGSLSALIPDNVLTALHASRLSGASVNEMRTEISNVEAEQAQLRGVNGELSSRLQLVEQGAGSVVRRVWALEVSVPKLVEAVAAAPQVDRTIITGSIPARKPTPVTAPVLTPTDTSTEATPFPLLPAGGLNVAEPATQPMPAALPTSSAARAAALPMPTAAPAVSLSWAAPALAAPRAATPITWLNLATASPGQVPSHLGAISASPAATTDDSMALGVALGDPVEPTAAPAAWQSLSAKAGPLLTGLVPLLAPNAAGSARLLVAGPVEGVAAAIALCHRFAATGIACEPAPFTGSAVGR